MSAARYLREVGQGYKIKGVVDCEQVRTGVGLNQRRSWPFGWPIEAMADR